MTSLIGESLKGRKVNIEVANKKQGGNGGGGQRRDRGDRGDRRQEGGRNNYKPRRKVKED